jgi:hypothetical protein
METVDEAADFFVGGGGGAALGGGGGRGFQVAAGAECFQEDRGDALEVVARGRGGGAVGTRSRSLAALGMTRWRTWMTGGEAGAAGEFVEADGDGLAKVHGAMVFAGGDAEEPVAVAEVFVGEAALFGAEEEGDAAGGEALADQRSSLLEALDGVLQFAVADGGGADDEGAVRDGFGEGGEFFGGGEDGGSADGGAGFTKSQFVWIDHAEVEETEVAHGAGGGADVERIARVDEDDAQAVEFGTGGQGTASVLHGCKEKGEYNRVEGWQNKRR